MVQTGEEREKEAAVRTAVSNQFFLAALPALESETREVFEGYSGLEPDKVISHITGVRNKAWAHSPYPCLGLFSFLSFSISSIPIYKSRILPFLKRTSAPTLLDIGCALGQDVRKLIHDGVSPSQLYASDLNAKFLDLGFEMFLDREKLDQSHFAPADIFDDSPDSKLREWDGKFDIILASSMLHLFDLEKQIWIARRICRLLKDRPHGTMIVGHQIGAVTPSVSQGTSMFRHTPDSWKEMWNEVGKETGMKWDIGTEMGDLPMSGSDEEGGVPFFRMLRERGERYMQFWIERIE